MNRRVRLPRFARGAAALAAALVAGLAPGAASALDCSTLPKPVIATGSSALKAIIGELAKVLAGGANPVTIVYQSAGSCNGVDAVVNGTEVTGTGTTAPSYWDPVAGEQQCDIAAPGVVADLGLSDVFPTSCGELPNGLPSNVGDFAGPIQAMVFIVPQASKQLSISAEAAYFAFGFGSNSGVTPWDQPSFLFTRDETSGTQQMVSAAIGVPADKWQGTVTTSTDDMRAKVVGSTSPENTLGIIAADAADSNRATLAVLAYQHAGESCGYWPDSDDSSFDKRNVRDGHYAIWGPVHILSKLNSNGYPVNDDAADIVDYLTGTKSPPGGLDVIDLEAQSHVVPGCAIRVQRTEELGALASFAPPSPCGCYFEKVASGSTDCQECSSLTECPDGTSACNLGYCEQ